jgi:hypothetical protein
MPTDFPKITGRAITVNKHLVIFDYDLRRVGNGFRIILDEEVYLGIFHMGPPGNKKYSHEIKKTMARITPFFFQLKWGYKSKNIPLLGRPGLAPAFCLHDRRLMGECQ